MYMSSFVSGQRILRVTQRARAISAIPPRTKTMTRTLSPPVQTREETEVEAQAPEADTNQFVPGDGVEGSRRRAPRSIVAGEVSVRRIGGFNFDAALHDVSIGGCRVEMLEPCEIGDRVLARFPALEPLGARVCWSAGATTGVEFHASVHPAVFDALLVRLQAA
jgi:PilZ domain-containing protein